MSEEYRCKLNNQSVDEISERIFRHCLEKKVEKKKAQSYRLNAEEALLKWMDAGYKDTDITLRFERRRLSDVIDIIAVGAELNPFGCETDDFGDYSSHLLESMQIVPAFSYSKGANRLTFSLPKKKLSQLQVLGCVLVAAIVTGILGNAFMSEASRNLLIDNLLSPAQNLFYKLLGFIAGPMIFLSVVWGINGIGDPKTFGKVGKIFVTRDIKETALFALLALLTIPVLGLSFGSSSGGGTQFNALLDMILNIIPPNIVEPFMSGNTLQIIFMAVIFGIALLFVGERGVALVSGVEQINYLIQFQMSFVSRLVPFVVFVLITKIIWSGTLHLLARTWIIIVLNLIIFAITLCIFIAVTASRLNISFSAVIKKILPTFMIALATASSSAAFANTTETCQNRFGVRKDIVNFGLPLGMILNRSILASNLMLYPIFFAKQSGMQISVQWIIFLFITTVLVSIATPPIAGGGAMAMSLLFTQTGISMEYLSIALTIDIIIDFFTTASQVSCVAMSLVLSAQKLDMIDEKAVQKD